MAEKKKKSKLEKLEQLEKTHSFIISFGDIYHYPRHQRAKKAIAKLKKFAYKHFRVNKNAVSISNALNERIWQHGREHVPRKISVKALLAEGKLKFYLESEKIEIAKREKKEEKPKEKELSEEEKKAAEEAKRRLGEKREKERAAEAAAIKLGTEK